jgi:hypothetical protein
VGRPGHAVQTGHAAGRPESSKTPCPGREEKRNY